MKKPGKAQWLQEEGFDWRLFENTRSTVNTSSLEVRCFRDPKNAEFQVSVSKFLHFQCFLDFFDMKKTGPKRTLVMISMP